MKKKDQFIYVAEIEKTLYQRQFYKKKIPPRSDIFRDSSFYTDPKPFYFRLLCVN